MTGKDETLSKDKDAPAYEHPPETAEDFAHTLRRLLVERDKARAGKPVNYK